MTLFEIPLRRVVVALAAITAAVALAACGSSTTTSTTSASASSGSSTTATTTSGHFNRTSFVSCLKKHGVTLPSRGGGAGAPGGGAGGAPPGGSGAPPAGGGGFFGGGGSASGGGFRSNPKFAAAFKACGGSSRFRGFGAGGARGRFRISHTAIDKYVACVRQHGYPQMPNPNFSGKGPVFPTSIRANKQFQSASRACASTLIPARPSGTGGTSTNPSS